MTKSAQRENPNLLEKQTKILKVKVLDGMVTVNKLQTTNETKTCEDLWNLFLQNLFFGCYEYDEISLGFDQYNFQNS